MRRIRNISNWLRSILRRDTVDQELRAELGFHISNAKSKSISPRERPSEKRAALSEFAQRTRELGIRLALGAHPQVAPCESIL
jgi:hypothetical protein